MRAHSRECISNPAVVEERQYKQRQEEAADARSVAAEKRREAGELAATPR